MGFGTVRGGEGSPFCSGLLDGGDCNSAICVFSASIWALIPRCITLLGLKSSINLCSSARQPLSGPPCASEIGEACLISHSAVLGVDSPHRRLLSFQYTGPDCFLQTGYLPVLADSVRAPTALFHVNFLALARLHCGVGDFHRALLLVSLFRCWVAIGPFSWPPSFI